MRFAHGKGWHSVAEHLFTEALDRVAARVIAPCDVFIGMSGMSTISARMARRKYGAQVWIERGSRHILSQKEILENMPGAAHRPKPVSDFAVRRELADYAVADTIVVPSLHVERSFLERGTNPVRLFRNPYGVDLTMFPATPAPRGEVPTIITAGAWSLRKGCDVLVQAWKSLNAVRLIHVGPVLDAPLPEHPDFEHHDTVPMWQLKEFYAQAHVFVLASREEGLALVQAQALACGLRLVCTDRTGGEDLKEFLHDPALVTVVPSDNWQALAEALKAALNSASRGGELRDLLGATRATLSWRAYGERYARELETRISRHCFEPAVAGKGKGEQ